MSAMIITSFFILSSIIVVPLLVLSVMCNSFYTLELALRFVNWARKDKSRASRRAEGFNLNVYKQETCPNCEKDLKGQGCFECNHLLCVTCCQTLIEESASHEKIKCPVCGKESTFIIDYIEKPSPEEKKALERIRAYNNTFAKEDSTVTYKSNPDS